MAKIKFDTDRAKKLAYDRYSAGWADWRGHAGELKYIAPVSEYEKLQDRVEWLEMENEMLRAQVDE